MTKKQKVINSVINQIDNFDLNIKEIDRMIEKSLKYKGICNDYFGKVQCTLPIKYEQLKCQLCAVGIAKKEVKEMNCDKIISFFRPKRNLFVEYIEARKKLLKEIPDFKTAQDNYSEIQEKLGLFIR